MNRLWLSFGLVPLWGSWMVHPHASPLYLDVIGNRSWSENLIPVSYTPTATSPTPEGSLMALKALPSTHLSRGQSGQTFLSFRGQSTSHTHLRLDGIPIENALGAKNIAPFLGSSTQIKSILPGSQGFLYGNGSSGGTVLMETPFLSSPNTMTLQGGSFETAFGHVGHQHSYKKSRWVLHGEGSRTKGLPQYGTTRQLGEKARSHTLHLATAVHHPITPTRSLKLTARTFEISSKYDPYFASAPLPSKPQGTQTVTLSLLGATLKNKSGPLHHKVQGFISQDRQKNSSYPSSSLLMTGATYQGRYKSHPKLHSLFLLGIQKNDIHTGDIKKKSLTNMFGGILQKVRLTKKVALEGGVRLDAHQKFGTTPTYHFLTSFTQNETTLKGGVRTGFLNPSPYSLYVTNDLALSNPNLKPEKTETFEISLEQKIPKHTLALQVTPFQSYSRKMIQSVFQNGRYRCENIPGTSKISGVESRIIFSPAETFTTTISHTYTNIDLSQANVNPEFPKHKLSGQLLYRHHSYTLIPEILYVSQRRTYQGTSLKEYAIVNCSLHYKAKPGLTIFGRLDNIFDTRYIDTQTYRTPGRSFYVGTHFYF